MVAGEREMVAGQPRNGGRWATQNIKEHKERSEASPLPFQSTASASPKKEKNGQQEKVVQVREINPATLAKMAPLHLKHLPID
jgi:hypothetical protein